MSESLRFAEDSQKRDLKGLWRKGPSITKENVVKGTGAIEHITADEFFGRGKTPEPGKSPMGFGKYRDKEMEWVKKNDPGYWEWALGELPHFAKRAEKLK